MAAALTTTATITATTTTKTVINNLDTTEDALIRPSYKPSIYHTRTTSQHETSSQPHELLRG